MTVDREQLVTALKTGSVEITFIKADGSTRVMQATLQESVLPPASGGGSRPHNPDIVHVWDLDKGAWRSVRMDRLQQVKLA